MLNRAEILKSLTADCFVMLMYTTFRGVLFVGDYYYYYYYYYCNSVICSHNVFMLLRRCETVAIGNGVGCRETEKLMSDTIQRRFFAPLSVMFWSVMW